MNQLRLSFGKILACFSLFLITFHVNASGIVLGGTRIIYPADNKQTTLNVKNTSRTNSFLVQSWVENSNGDKTNHFLVTPPLYRSNPQSENILRIVYSGPAVPRDRESLYFFNSKSIPSVDKEKLKNSNILMLAAISRIKLFIRPAGLSPAVDKAPEMLTFKRTGNQLQITNPTPYYITMTGISAGNKKIKDVMVAPRSSDTIAYPVGGNQTLSFSTINDYGAFVPATPRQIP